MPTPPLRVLRMKTKTFGSVLNRCIIICVYESHISSAYKAEENIEQGQLKASKS